MTPSDIRHEYHACRMTYREALAALMGAGYTAASSDAFLYCRGELVSA